MPRFPTILCLSLVFALMGSSAIIGSLVYPWWGMRYDDPSLYGAKQGSEVATLLSWEPSTMSLTTFYATFSYTNLLSISIAIIMVSSLLLSGIICVSILLFSMNHLRYKNMMVTLLFVMLLLVISSPIIYAVFWPVSLRDDAIRDARDRGLDYSSPGHTDPTYTFMGHYDSGDSHYVWGPDLGWFLSFVSGFWFLLSLVFLIFGKQTSEKDDEERQTVKEAKTSERPKSRSSKDPKDMTDEELEEEIRKSEKRKPIGNHAPSSKKDPKDMTDEELEEEIRRMELRKAHPGKGKEKIKEF
jgi:hypothetical protein